MRRVSISSVIFFMLTVTFPLSAQEVENKYGIGVNFAKDFVYANVGGADYSILALPYDFSNISFIVRGEKFRLEPMIGYFRYGRNYSQGSSSSKYSYSNWRLGANLSVNNANGAMHHYYGITIGVILSSMSSEITSEFNSGKNDESKTDFFIGPILGGEYNFNEFLSLGGEIQFNYISLGQYNDDSDAEISESLLTTRAIIVLRWYFK